MLVPLASGEVVQRLIVKYVYNLDKRDTTRLEVVTVTHSITAFPVVLLLLEDLQLLTSEIGRLSQSATLVCDVFTVVLQYFIGSSSFSKSSKLDTNSINLGAAIADIVNDSVYAVMFSSVVVTSVLVPIVVKHLYEPSRKYAGYERRDIMHLKPNAELKVLTCIHRSSNIPAVINLLDAACPSKENPITVYVLRLI
ncbi:hypothetical protein ACLB2K_030979 [Fragaria x ananassa]